MDERMGNKKEKVIAILTADIHLSHKPPVWRSNEPDWYAAMRRPLYELQDLQQKYECPILAAGDMCNKWNSVEKDIGPCKVKIFGNPYGNIVVTGQMKDILERISITNDIYVKYWAANKPNYGLSYAGSGLPFPNEHIAFQDTDNSGVTEVKGGSFTFNIHYPNSYYKNMGKVYVEPQVKVQFCSKNNVNLTGVHVITLGNGIPFRSLTWPRKRNWYSGPMFYCNINLPVRTQAQILKASAYPCVNKEPTNFWGTMPPH